MTNSTKKLRKGFLLVDELFTHSFESLLIHNCFTHLWDTSPYWCLSSSGSTMAQSFWRQLMTVQTDGLGLPTQTIIPGLSWVTLNCLAYTFQIGVANLGAVCRDRKTPDSDIKDLNDVKLFQEQLWFIFWDQWGYLLEWWGRSSRVSRRPNVFVRVFQMLRFTYLYVFM